MTGDGAVFKFIPLRGENSSSHAHNTGSQYFLGVRFKISNEHLCPSYMGIPTNQGKHLNTVLLQNMVVLIFIYQFNKLTSVFYVSVLLLMINCIIILSKWLWNHDQPQASGSAVNFDNVMMKFIFNKRTDA